MLCSIFSLGVGLNQTFLFVFLSCSCILAVISFADDLHPLPSWLRLGCQSFCALIVFFMLGYPNLRISLGSDFTFTVPTIFSFGLVLLWLVGYTNAFNFMDGINGLAAGQALITAGGSGLLAALATGRWESLSVVFAFILAGAAAGFLPHNFPRARMFMGDVGSIPLGFFLGVLPIWLARDCGSWLLVPLILLHANFFLDTGFTLVRRILTGQRWYEAHSEHFYQRLVRSGKSHATVTTLEMGLQCLVLLLLLLYVKSDLAVRLMVVASVVAAWAAFFYYCEREYQRRQGSEADPGSPAREDDLSAYPEDVALSMISRGKFETRLPAKAREKIGQ
jgi:UDP-N-acetylmuramyl pentapeptide phosphotransferase/UDP-N-acetylglucosamine-1-phosphate transferase